MRHHPVHHKHSTRHHFQGISVVGDVHGDVRSFNIAIQRAFRQRHFMVMLGDIVDYGNDSVACLKQAMRMVHRDTGILIAGNHEAGLYRHLMDKRQGKTNPYRGKTDGLGRTLLDIARQPNQEALEAQLLEFLGNLPAWAWVGKRLYAHAAWHPDCEWDETPPTLKDVIHHRHPTVYGYNSLGTDSNTGRPIRDHAWVDLLTTGYEITVGHEIVNRSTPQIMESARGGRALFLDTGCGKGGRLSMLDIPRHGPMRIHGILPSHILKRRRDAAQACVPS